MKIKNTKIFKPLLVTTFVLLVMTSFAHYHFSNQNGAKTIQKVIETVTVIRSAKVTSVSVMPTLSSVRESNERLISESVQNMHNVTNLYNWSKMNTLIREFRQNTRTFETFKKDTESLITNYSLKGLGVEVVRSELRQLELLISSNQKIIEAISILDAKTDFIPDKISKSTKPQESLAANEVFNINIFFVVELLLISAIAVLTRKMSSNFEHNQAVKQISKNLETNFALETGFVSSVFDMNGKCLYGIKSLNVLLEDFKTGESSLVEDWASIAELIGLNNSYSLKDLPDGTHRYNVKAKGLDENEILLEIIFNINSDNNRVGVLFRKNSNVDHSINSIVELPDLRALNTINLSDTIDYVLEKLSSFFIANGVKVDFAESDELSLRVNKNMFEERITNLIQVLVQNCSEKNNLQTIKITTNKSGATVFINFSIDGDELDLKVLLDVVNGRSIEEEICGYERDFKYLNAKVLIKNNFDSKNIFMYSDICLESKII